MNLDRRALGIGTIALAIVLFLSVNVFSTAVFRTAQLDLTEEGLFTLSPGTHEILQSIDEPITLRLYLSEQLRQADPTFARYATRVQELLEQYERIAGGRLILQLFNPEPFTQEEDRAVGFGLRGVPVNEVGDLVYFGLVGTNSTDDQDAIVFFSPEREPFLEYDLTRLVYNLANPERRCSACSRRCRCRPIRPSSTSRGSSISRWSSSSTSVRWIPSYARFRRTWTS